MYERFYRLRERPFALTPDPDYLYPSRVHREALNYLRYGIETHAGFIVITGAIGSGKTTLLQTLIRGLDNQTTVARVMNTLLDPRELIEAAMLDLGLDPAGKSKPAMLKNFGEFLVNERAAGRIVLLVIDEAQNLSLPALEEIRMLSNLETEKSKLVQIVLIGQPDLRDKLDRPELEQLRQRITVSYHLEPLDADETARYVNHRLARASIGAPLEFPRAVTDRIHARSAGVPRLINVIADATLVFGYGEERCEVDEALVIDVIADLDATAVLGPRPNPSRRASIVPVDPPAAAPTTVALPTGPATPAPGAIGVADAPAPPTAGSGIGGNDADQQMRALVARERQLHEREQEMASRERELTEQRRVLTEQYRLLRTAPAAAAPPLQSPASAATIPGRSAAAGAPSRLDLATKHAPQGWPSARTVPGSNVPAGASPRGAAAWPNRVYRSRRPGFWRRVKHTLLGSQEPVLEDSL